MDFYLLSPNISPLDMAILTHNWPPTPPNPLDTPDWTKMGTILVIVHNPNLMFMNFLTGLGNVTYHIGIDSDASSFLCHIAAQNILIKIKFTVFQNI